MSSLVRQILQEGRQIRALDDGARAILANLQAPFPDRLIDGSLAERGKCCIAARIEHRDSENPQIHYQAAAARSLAAVPSVSIPTNSPDVPRPFRDSSSTVSVLQRWRSQNGIDD